MDSITILYALGGVFVIYFGLVVFIVARLRDRHQALWVSLGSPEVFTRDSSRYPWASKPLLGYLVKFRYFSTGDLVLILACASIMLIWAVLLVLLFMSRRMH